MNEISHLDPYAVLPPPMPVDPRDLPWARRERADSNIRRAIGDLKALAREDTAFTEQYLTMARTFDAALRLLDAIEVES